MALRLACFLLCLPFALLTPSAQAKLHHWPKPGVRATVYLLDAASGRYALVADNGSIFEPTNLKRAYQIDGMRVKFTAKPLVRPAPRIAGARVVKITSIHTLPGSAVSETNPLKPRQAGAPGIQKWP